MAAVSLDAFLDNLRQSHLLAAEECEALHSDRSGSADELAGRLVEDGKLTGWQARMLLVGHHAFFLGRYKLLEHLGEGGMGSVFQAEQTPLGRVVALKVLRKSMVDSQEAVTRFRREIQLAAALAHPNIVSAYDADHVGDRYVLVMEYVEGTDLGTLVEGKKQLPVGQACEYIRQAALGLQHAHERGMVHRDIKPSNLLLKFDSRTQEPGRVAPARPDTGRRSSRPIIKILDFGLSRFESERVEEGGLTRTGQIMGTPDYISPEQARDTHSADIRSDIYSLGCTLFRLLTGRLPFVGSNTVAKLLARTERDAPRLREYLPEAPAELESIVANMLARDPAERYQTPSEVAQALVPFSRSSETSAASEGTSPPEPRMNIRGDSSAANPDPSPTEAFSAEFQGFLNQLATEADEEPESGELVETVISGEETGRQATQNQSQLQREIAERRERDRRRLIVAAIAAVLLVVAVSGYAVWYKAGEVTLTIDWPGDDLQSASLTVNGRQRRFPNAGELHYRGRPGIYRLKLVREGYEPVETTMTLERSQNETLRPAWTPTAATRRKQTLANLERRLGDALAPFSHPSQTNAATEGIVNDPQIARLRSDLFAFRRKHKDTGESLAAARLMSRLPWPVDLFRREEIDPQKLQTAGEGDPENAPQALVAILGDNRLRHWQAASGVAFMSNDSRLVSGGRDNTVRIWDTASGAQTAAFRTPIQQIRSIAYSVDGLIAAGGIQPYGLVHLIRLSTGEAVDLTGQENAIESVAFSPDGRILASGSRDGTVWLWDADSHEKLRILRPEGGLVMSVRFHPRDEALAVGTLEGVVGLWDVEKGEELTRFTVPRTLEGNPWTVRGLGFSPDGATLAGAFAEGLQFWNVESGEVLDTQQRQDRNASLAISSDGALLALGKKAAPTIVWDVKRRIVKRQLPVDDEAWGVAFSPDGSLVAATSLDGGIRVVDVESGSAVPGDLNFTGMCRGVAVSPDGQFLATVHADNAVRLWDLSKREVIQTLDDEGAGGNVSFSPDGTRVLFGAINATARVWHVDSDEVTTLGRHGSKCAFSPDGRWIATVAQDGAIRLWDAASGEIGQEIEAHQGPAGSVAFDPESRLLATGGIDRIVRIWDIRRKRKLHRLRGHGQAVFDVAFSPDGKLLASADDDSRIVVWDVKSGEQQVVLDDHRGSAQAVRFSPDGELLASCSKDGTVRVWDFRRDYDHLVRTFRLAHRGGLIGKVAFTPDGRHLVTANGNGTVYVLRLQEWSATLDAAAIGIDGTTGANADRRADETADRR